MKRRSTKLWCSDVTYIPMRRCFLYLVVIMDWAARKVLAWRLSDTLEAELCVEAPHEALTRFGPPDIMNTDQGRQFTSWAWTNRLGQAGVKISMDGKRTEFYNQQRPHSSLDGRTPYAVLQNRKQTEQPGWRTRIVA